MNETATAPLAAPPRGRPNLPSWIFTVKDAFDVSARFRRVVFTTAGSENFTYLPGQDVVFFLPLEGGELGRRHYTIRSVDRATGEIAIDFLLHGSTPGPEFARNAKPGDTVEVKGPRGRVVARTEADWHLFTGDETGLPAILHIVETLPEGAKIFAFVEVQSEDDKFAFETKADVQLEWIIRGDAPAGPSALVLDRIAAFELPTGEGRALLTGETSNVRALRHHLVGRGLAKEQIASEGYWRPGRLGGHDHVDD